MHTLSEAAKILGCRDPRHLTNCMQLAGIDHKTLPRGAHDLRQRLLTDAQLEQLRDAYAQLYGPKQHTHSAPSGDLGAILARLDAIEQQLATLRERASWLFAPVTRSEGRQTALDVLEVSSISHPPVRRPRASYVPPASSASDGAWPASANGRGKWVARHGGPGTAWARTFDDVKEWQGPEDAIAAVRRHQRWHDWQPTECADPSCQCHQLLGGSVEVSVDEE